MAGEDLERGVEALLPERGWRAHLSSRCAAEWAIIRKRLFPEWACLIFCVIYLNKVVRFLGFVRHRQMADYIPEAWCRAIASSPLKPAGWKAGDSCLDHAKQLTHGGALLDVLHEGLPQLSGNLELIPEMLETAMAMLVFAACLLGCLSKPCGGTPRPYLSNVATRCLRCLSVVFALRPLFFLGTSLPGPNDKCIGPAEATLRPHDWRASFYDFSLSADNCGDLIFSGHMAALTILVCCYFHYGRAWLAPRVWLYRLGACFCLVSWAAQPFLIAMAHNHYTIDMVCGVLVAGLVWRLLEHELGSDPKPWDLIPDKGAEVAECGDEAFAQHVQGKGKLAGAAALLAVCVGFVIIIVLTFVSLVS